MAPENIVVSVVAVPASIEAVLAEKSAAVLATSQPQKAREQIVNDLLERLRKEKSRRELKGINHWDQYAPQFLERLVERLSARHRSAVSRFIRDNHEAALELAWRITRNWDLAERAVAQTYVELWEGKTGVQHFFRALKMNARDLLDRRNVRQSHFDSLDGLLAHRRPAVAASGEECEDESDAMDFASQRPDDQDPLDILIRQEEAGLYGRMVRSALADPRWRYIKRREWARPLAKCADLMP
jgi:hypothetical protein